MDIIKLEKWLQDNAKPSGRYKIYRKNKLSRADEAWKRLKRYESAQELGRCKPSIVKSRELSAGKGTGKGKTFLEPPTDPPRTITPKIEELKPVSPEKLKRYEERDWH